MKKTFLYGLLGAILLSSCSSQQPFYQVYKVESPELNTNNTNAITFEDENCVISYNLWSDGGDIGFQIKNKKDEILYLNLEQTYFIINDMAYDYFQNRTITQSSNSNIMTNKSSNFSLFGLNLMNDYLFGAGRVSFTNATGMITSSGSSTSYTEQKIISIPPKSSKIISDFTITNHVFRDCELYLYPNKKQVKSITFNPYNSPYTFKNYITYRVGNMDWKKIENNFYISEITNYPENVLTEMVTDEFCGKKDYQKHRSFKNVAPNMFYIRYIKTSDHWKH